jgi:hypothetical protein
MNRVIGKICVRRTRAETARRLQRVLETNSDMPPIQHDRSRRQRLALQPPQPGITIAKHRRRRVSAHPGGGERLLERVRGGRLAVADEGEAALSTSGVDHLARDHLEMALLLSMAAAHVAAIKSNRHSATRGRRGPLRRLSGVPADDLLAHPLCPVSNRTRVLRPADRQQFAQQRRDLAERRQRRTSGRNVGQLWCNRIMAEIQNAEALHFNRVLTGTDK